MNTVLARSVPLPPVAAPRLRRVVYATRGNAHGPITRLFSPGDLGELIKPFVFLDYGVLQPGNGPMFGIHPHSGIATISLALTGAFRYEDTTGKSGVVPTGGVEWMRAGKGVWHDAQLQPGEAFQFFQLWLAMPAALELAPAESQYIGPEDVQHDGPVTVVLGQYGDARSIIRSPEGVNYFKVELEDGQTWRYAPPRNHTVGWIAVYEGELRSPTAIPAGTVAVFNETDDALELTAQGKTSFVIGTAIKHPHPLELGHYSVHTSRAALEQGETEIRRIGAGLQADGRLRI
jgi:redox-sensitive bicupin YhaK (pirin superfamily)